MYLIVGLGNPDKQYENTFHNVGFMAVDKFAALLNVQFNKGECRALTAHARVGKEKVIIAKPITYMNLSGESVMELIRKYKIEREKFAVVFDDADLPLGGIRIRKNGSGGSHNGMKNVVDNVRTEDIFRIRIGIGRPTIDGMELRDYVLGKVNDEQKVLLAPALENAAHALESFVKGASADEVMNAFNKRNRNNADKN